MNKLFFAAIAASLLWINIAKAAPSDTIYRALKDTAGLKVLVNNYSKNLVTLESNFTQLKYLSVLTEPNISKGYFCFKSGAIRWEYTVPFAYLIIINNNRLFVVDDKKSNSFDLSASKAFMALNASLGKIMQGNVLNDAKDFSCRYFENETTYKLILSPKDKDLKSFFNQIVIYFDKKLFSVSRVVMIELSGDQTDIEFLNRKINAPIPDEKFNVK